jgi:hypothetical protein
VCGQLETAGVIWLEDTLPIPVPVPVEVLVLVQRPTWLSKHHIRVQSAQHCRCEIAVMTCSLLVGSRKRLHQNWPCIEK